MSQMYDDYVWSFVYEQSWLIKETIKKKSQRNGMGGGALNL